MDGDDASAHKGDELAALIQEIRDRVRARYPSGDAGPGAVPLPDLTPILHARDAAEAKVASIGSVNPRPPGLLNNFIQAVKRLIARSLDWHVREQIEFNRAVMACVQSCLDALNEYNRAFVRLSLLCGEAADSRSAIEQWRREWEHKVATNEVQFLRNVADLQSAYHHRLALTESNFRELVRSQHADFTVALEKASLDIQNRFWADQERIRTDYERLIHDELRVVRQRAAAFVPQPAPPSAAPLSPFPPSIDSLKFADRFRGSEDYVRRNQAFYLDQFRACRSVLDIGCGRGEFLEILNEAGVPARGIESDPELVAICRRKGLDVQHADLFAALDSLPAGSLDGIFCAQLIEHLPPRRVPEIIRLAAAALARDGLIAIETPNPECLAIFTTHFYLDPSHTRPIPSPLLVFYLEEAGFGRAQVHRLSPAIESMPSLAALPDDFRKAFFDGLDYAVLARKL